MSQQLGPISGFVKAVGGRVRKYERDNKNPLAIQEGAPQPTGVFGFPVSAVSADGVQVQDEGMPALNRRINDLVGHEVLPVDAVVRSAAADLKGASSELGDDAMNRAVNKLAGSELLPTGPKLVLLNKMEKATKSLQAFSRDRDEARKAQTSMVRRAVAKALADYNGDDAA